MLPSPRITDHPVDIGQRSEAAIISAFVQRGYRVLLPFGHNHRYDLVLDLGDRFLRVQCKTGRYRRGGIMFNTVSTRCNTNEVVRQGYGGQIDAFAVFCPDNGRIYAVPVEDAPRGIATLRLDPTVNGQAKRVRWAADYELPA